MICYQSIDSASLQIASFTYQHHSHTCIRNCNYGSVVAQKAPNFLRSEELEPLVIFRYLTFITIDLLTFMDEVSTHCRYSASGPGIATGSGRHAHIQLAPAFARLRKMQVDVVGTVLEPVGFKSSGEDRKATLPRQRMSFTSSERIAYKGTCTCRHGLASKVRPEEFVSIKDHRSNDKAPLLSMHEAPDDRSDR